jgi:hypothetical protein
LVTVTLTAGVSGGQRVSSSLSTTAFQLMTIILRAQLYRVSHPGAVWIFVAVANCVARESPADLLDSNDWNLGASSVWLLHDGPDGLAPAMEPQTSILIRAS